MPCWQGICCRSPTFVELNCGICCMEQHCGAPYAIEALQAVKLFEASLALYHWLLNPLMKKRNFQVSHCANMVKSVLKEGNITWLLPVFFFNFVMSFGLKLLKISGSFIALAYFCGISAERMPFILQLLPVYHIYSCNKSEFCDLKKEKMQFLWLWHACFDLLAETCSFLLYKLGTSEANFFPRILHGTIYMSTLGML